MSKKKQKKTKITFELAEEMFVLFLEEKSYQEIADAFKDKGVNKQNVYTTSRRFDWHQRKDDIKTKMAKAMDDTIVQELVSEKTKRIKSVGYLMGIIHDKLKEDFENRFNPAYKPHFDIDSLSKINTVYKMFYDMVNDGVEKSETTNNNNNSPVTFALDDETRKMLLSQMADGKVEKGENLPTGLHLVGEEKKVNEED